MPLYPHKIAVRPGLLQWVGCHVHPRRSNQNSTWWIVARCGPTWLAKVKDIPFDSNRGLLWSLWHNELSFAVGRFLCTCPKCSLELSSRTPSHSSLSWFLVVGYVLPQWGSYSGNSMIEVQEYIMFSLGKVIGLTVFYFGIDFEDQQTWDPRTLSHG